MRVYAFRSMPRATGAPTLAVWAVAALALALAPLACAWPASFSSNGSVHLETANGGNLYLSPAVGGVVTARALLDAQGGLQLNNTALNSAFFDALAGAVQAQATTTQAQFGAVAAQTNATQEQLNALTASVASLAQAVKAQCAARALCGQCAAPALCGTYDDASQCSALLALLRNTGWKQESFPTAAPATYCKWPGVTCSGPSASDVVGLSFRGKGYAATCRLTSAACPPSRALTCRETRWEARCPMPWARSQR